MPLDLDAKVDAAKQDRSITLAGKTYPASFVSLDLAAEIRPLLDNYNKVLERLNSLTNKAASKRGISEEEKLERTNLGQEFDDVIRELIVAHLDPTAEGDQLTVEVLREKLPAEFLLDTLTHVRFATNKEIAIADALASNEDDTDPT